MPPICNIHVHYPIWVLTYGRVRRHWAQRHSAQKPQALRPFQLPKNKAKFTFVAQGKRRQPPPNTTVFFSQCSQDECSWNYTIPCTQSYIHFYHGAQGRDKGNLVLRFHEHTSSQTHVLMLVPIFLLSSKAIKFPNTALAFLLKVDNIGKVKA